MEIRLAETLPVCFFQNVKRSKISATLREVYQLSGRKACSVETLAFFSEYEKGLSNLIDR
jgi:hypothetical protein